MSESTKTCGVILAGGRATRMGGEDKGLVLLGGRPMVAWIAAALAPQVDALIINANRNIDRYAALGYPVVPDALAEFQGPLAGMASAMQAMGPRDLVTAPCDSPFVPPDLVARLRRSRATAGAGIAVAHDGGRLQPVFALISCSLRASLEAFLARGDRKIDLWFEQCGYATADFSDCQRTFININSPDELRAIETEFLKRGSAA
jgi:molybdenum cofactor guanylyltransferase